MAAVYNGSRGVGKFSERGRQTVAIAYRPHKTNESIGLPGMVGEQADSVEHLAKAAFHPFEEFPCFRRRVWIVFSQCRNSRHLRPHSHASTSDPESIQKIPGDLLGAFLPPESYWAMVEMLWRHSLILWAAQVYRYAMTRRLIPISCGASSTLAKPASFDMLSSSANV